MFRNKLVHRQMFNWKSLTIIVQDNVNPNPETRSNPGPDCNPSLYFC